MFPTCTLFQEMVIERVLIQIRMVFKKQAVLKQSQNILKSINSSQLTVLSDDTFLAFSARCVFFFLFYHPHYHSSRVKIRLWTFACSQSYSKTLFSLKLTPLTVCSMYFQETDNALILEDWENACRIRRFLIRVYLNKII